MGIGQLPGPLFAVPFSAGGLYKTGCVNFSILDTQQYVFVSGDPFPLRIPGLPVDNQLDGQQFFLFFVVVAVA